jgi:hypothetical protein
VVAANYMWKRYCGSVVAAGPRGPRGPGGAGGAGGRTMAQRGERGKRSLFVDVIGTLSALPVR